MTMIHKVVNHTKWLAVYTANEDKANELADCMKRANSKDTVDVYSYYNESIARTGDRIYDYVIEA